MDPIADMLNRIMNGQAALRQVVEMPGSLAKTAVLNILKDKGFIKDFKEKSEGAKKTIAVILNQKKPIDGFKKISKPGKRIYKPSKDIKAIKSGFGVMIVSTSKGVLTSQEARKQKVGGEAWLEVW